MTSSSSIIELANEDRKLVDRCLQGEVGAWQELYQQQHEPLTQIVRSDLGHADFELVDEVVARVWFAVVADDGAVLDKFDPKRGCRLKTFLAAVAKNELRVHFRSEGRRKAREQASLSTRSSQETPHNHDLSEMLETLTPAERRFYDNYLLNQDDSDSLSESNKWQLRHRVRRKVESYLRDNESE